MRISLHAGAHATDENRLVKSLLLDRQELRDMGTVVPGPSRYRQELRTALHEAARGTPGPLIRESLMERMTGGREPDRLVLSFEHFFCVPKLVLENGRLYDKAEGKLNVFSQIFEQDDDRAELYLALRNPATFLPHVFEMSPFDDFREFMDGFNPRRLLWSDLLKRIRASLPDLPITVWCDEDAPLLWPEILRRISGTAPDTRLRGGFSYVQDIMTEEGANLLSAFDNAHPDMTEAQRRQAMVAFLDRFALPEALEEDVGETGWDSEMVETLTDIYDEDVMHLEEIPGVVMLQS